MHPMTQTGLTLLVMALTVLVVIAGFAISLYLADKFRTGKHYGEKVLGAVLLAVAAAGALLMFIGSKL